MGLLVSFVLYFLQLCPWVSKSRKMNPLPALFFSGMYLLILKVQQMFTSGFPTFSNGETPNQMSTLDIRRILNELNILIASQVILFAQKIFSGCA